MKPKIRVTNVDDFNQSFVEIYADVFKDPIRLQADEVLDLANSLIKAVSGRVLYAAVHDIKWLIFRALVAVTQREEYAKYVRFGKLGTYGPRRYILLEDLGQVAKELDADLFTKRVSDNPAWKLRTIALICKQDFQMPIVRSGSHGGMSVVVLELGMFPALTRTVSDRGEINS